MEGSFSILNEIVSPDGRKKKSYLNSRNRERGVTVKRASEVKESISRFLDGAQHEDLLFNVSASPKTIQTNGPSCSIDGTSSGERRAGLPSESDHLSKDIAVSPMDESFSSRREMPFDRRTAVRKSPSHVKPKLKRKGHKHRPGCSKNVLADACDYDDDNNDDDDDDDLQSFAVDDGEDDEQVSPLSLDRRAGGRKSIQSENRTQSSRSSQATHEPPSRTRSAHSRLDSLPSSSRLPPRRSQSLKRSQVRRHQSIGSIANGLGTIDRNSRLSRIKQKHRSNSCEDDDGDSVTSGMSTLSARSRRSSGLEGGALNAFLGDETMARNASLGKGVFSGAAVATTSADEKFLQARKARQDLIMDVAIKEKWLYEERSREQAEMVERLNTIGTYSDDSSDEDGLKFGKKKGIVGNLKKAVRKSAKLTKSGAKGTVNMVKDPKRAAMKVGGFAKDVGKETTKMVLDPTLAAKRTAKGVKGTVKLTTKVTNTVAKGSYGVTKSIAKTGVKGTTKVVGKTIDGVVHGATGLFSKRDEVTEGDKYAEYDPSALTNRRKRDSLVDRFGEAEITTTHDVDDFDKSRIPVHTNILAPTIKTGGVGNWDV
jgi:hypothetical protein